ncbi:hypothetical protein AHF37_03525 [Paragonimus kellicotti]|nr:hypothetical protein AHF37_03525 [Paragonimus kellicotti]
MGSLDDLDAPTELSQPTEQAEISSGVKTSEVFISDFEPSDENLITEVHQGTEAEMQTASVHEINPESFKTDEKGNGFVYAKKETETVNLESVQESVGQSNECIAVELETSPIPTHMISSSPPDVFAACETSLPELRDSAELPDFPATEHGNREIFLETSPTELSDVTLSGNRQTSEVVPTQDVNNEHLHQAEQHIVHESVQPELCHQISEENSKVAELSSTECYAQKSNGPIEPVQRGIPQDIQRRPLSDVKQRSKTLEPHIMASWMDHYLDPKKRSATLGRSEYRRRPKLQPKPAPNDDHLYPDSVTPSKVDRGLSVRSMSIGLPEGTYDVPYIDDDAFLPRKLRTVQNNHTNSSEDSEVSSEDTIDWFWQSNGARDQYLDPAHIADTNECVPTPVLIQKVEKKPANRKRRVTNM